MTPEQQQGLRVEDILDDAALTDVRDDRFEHQAVARKIGDLVCASNPPVNVALYGPWGSGKSSFYALMKARTNTNGPRYRVVPYNAWKYGGESLKRNFITSIARELGLDDEDYEERLTQSREQRVQTRHAVEHRLGRADRGRWQEARSGHAHATMGPRPLPRGYRAANSSHLNTSRYQLTIGA